MRIALFFFIIGLVVVAGRIFTASEHQAILSDENLPLEKSVDVIKASLDVADSNLKLELKLKVREAAEKRLVQILTYGEPIEVLAHLPLSLYFKEDLKLLDLNLCRFNPSVGSEREQLQVEMIRSWLLKFNLPSCKG